MGSILLRNTYSDDETLKCVLIGTDLGAASYTTTDARQGTTANTDWNTTPITKSGSVTGLNWTTSSFLIFRWEGVSVDINDLQLNEIALDNISITAIPEPSTYVLVLGGLAFGLVVWNRKRALLGRAA